MMGAETNLYIFAKQLPRKSNQRAFQVAHCDILIHHKPLHLMEYRGMCRVYLIGTVNRTGADHTDRQLALLHGTHLHRGGLRPQKDFAIDIECVLFISCGMVFRDI